MEPRPYDIPELATAAFWHFEDVLDFIWKAPDFIEAQREIELENFRRGQGESVARSRWNFEHRKLWKVFPGLLANANVFLVASLLELHLQMILEGVSGQPVPAKGRGIRDTLQALNDNRLNTEEAVRWPQVDALIRIRNCLMHSAGVLERSRDVKGIEELVEQRLYLDRKAAAKETNAEAIVRIVQLRVGKRLVVDNTYAWIAAAYCRDYVVEICGGKPLGE